MWREGNFLEFYELISKEVCTNKVLDLIWKCETAHGTAVYSQQKEQEQINLVLT